MKKYVNKIIQGDCLKIMKTIEDNSIDTIITDPPAGISFMGKSWDSNKGGRDKWIEWMTEVMKECYRVAKPGSTALVWAIPRTSHWTATAIENAGWQIKDIIMHIFGSGFPKSTDISKQLDKGHERKVVGRNPNSRENCDKSNTLYESGTVGKTDNLTEPATPEAKLWNGYGTALKPAAEHWILAQKPNDGTYANNALKWGVSGLNIDGGRIPMNKEKEKDNRVGTKRIRGDKEGLNSTSIFKQTKKGVQMYKDNGRFPANIILDEEAAEMLDEQSGNKCGQLAPTTGKGPSASKKNQIYGDYSMVAGKPSQPRGLSGASRFFYCAKSSKSERNFGCEGLEKKDNLDYEIDPEHPYKSGHRNDNNANQLYMGITGKPPTKQQNNHPTVKPLKLMEYLCTITKTPTGGIVLDPFAGSGTTCIAAKKTGRDCIGIEKDESYCEIANKRIKAIPLKLFK